MEFKQMQMNEAAWLQNFLTGTADRLIFNAQFILSLLFMTIVTAQHFH